MADITSTATETAGESTADSQSAGKHYTQEDLEKLIDTRLKRERSKTAKAIEDAKAEAVASWREEHGIDDAAIERLGDGGELQQMRKELKVARAEATKSKTLAEQLTAKHDKAVSMLRQTLVVDTLLREASGKFVDPHDAVLHLSPMFRVSDEDYSVYVADEKGEPTETSPADLVADLLKRKPHLARPTGGVGGGAGAASASSGDGAKVPSRDDRLAMWSKLVGP